MKRTIELYIDGQRADIDSESLILLNYSLTDLTNPTAVKNSYSQSVTLPGTPTNDGIFGHIYRVDHITQAGGFSPMVRTPFVIRDVNGSVLESGYLRLTEITQGINGQHAFKVSLFGGLGSFLWSLTYGSEGDKRTLADLVYLNGGGTDELSFDITRQNVATAWSYLGRAGSAVYKWDVINFAPCYNGAPTDFDADKLLLTPGSSLGRIPSTHPEDPSYGTQDGYLLAELGQGYDEWTMRDLRSYLQRPVLRVRAVIEACCRAANNGGWTVNLDSAFFNNNNPYWDKTWMALGMLSAQTGYSPSSAPVTVSYGGSAMSGEGSYTLTPSQALNPGKTTAIINSLLNIYSGSEEAEQYLYAESGGDKYETYLLVQLVGYDSNHSVVGSSPLIALEDEGAGLDARAVALAIGYTPPYDAYGTSQYGTIIGGKWSEPLQQVCSGYDAAYWKLHYKAVTKKVSGWYHRTVTWETPRIFDDREDTRTYYGFTAAWAKDTGATDSIRTENFDGIRSGAHITKQMLLGSGSVTPASFLLSYCKTFGLYITADSGSKTISIRTRNTQYDGVRLDWSGRVDRSKDITTVPVAAESQWYELAHEVVEGASAKDYADEYGRDYGSMRLNTGYEFAPDVKDLLEGNDFKAAVEVLGMSRDYSTPKVGNTSYPNWMVSSVKVTYYGASGDTKEMEAGNITPTSRVPWSTILDNADCFPKAQFCDADGQEVDGYGTMLFYCPTKYTGYTGNYYLSDDWSGMYEMNGGTPCWLVDTVRMDRCQLAYPPQFSRAMRSNDLRQITKQLEFTTPKQIYNGYVNSYLGTQALYPKFWAAYLGDLYDADARVMTCRVDLRGVKVDAELLRHFYCIDGGLWVLNKINNYSITTLDTCECEFVKVKDATDYTNGQDLT